MNVVQTKKKGNLIVAVAIALLIVLQMSYVSAMAGNTSDTTYTFDFYSSNVDTTPERYKEDDTSVYMNCTGAITIEDSYLAEAWGWDTDTGWQSCQGPQYSFSQGTYRFMTNYINENDMDYAWIRGYLDYASNNGQAYFTGVWSPDSNYR